MKRCKLIPARRERFLKALADTGSVTAAVAVAGTSRTRCYELRKGDPAFLDLIFELRHGFELLRERRPASLSASWMHGKLRPAHSRPMPRRPRTRLRTRPRWANFRVPADLLRRPLEHRPRPGRPRYAGLDGGSRSTRPESARDLGVDLGLLLGGATMGRKSSLPQPAPCVSYALMPDKPRLATAVSAAVARWLFLVRKYRQIVFSMARSTTCVGTCK